MRRRTAAVLLLAGLAAAGCRKTEQPVPSGAHLRKPKVTAAPVAVREVEYRVEAPGTLVASEEIAIPAAVSGLVDAVHFKEGDEVGPDTVLAEIEPEKFRLGEARAQADWERAKAQADLMQTLYENRLKLQEEGKRQKKEYVTEEQMATWKADLEKAKADAARTRADLELARRDHRNARIRSPIRGILNSKGISRGEYVKAETVVATILNVTPLHVRFAVPELEASRLSQGQEVRFAVRSAPGRTFKARLFWLSQKAESVTRTVEGKAEVLETADVLRAGTYAEVRMTTAKQSGLVVPERAVLPTEKGFTVFVLEGSTARARLVKLGLRLEGGVEVVEGLKPGETIVVDGALTMRDGVVVEVVPEAPKPAPAAGAGT